MASELADIEVKRILRAKWPSHTPRERRKSKLKMWFKGRLDHEIHRTQEKLDLLREIKDEL